MRIRPLLLVLVLAGSLVVACSSNSDDDDDGASPSPTAFRSFAFNGIDYAAHGGNRASVRVREGATVVFCGSSGTIAADFTITAPGTILQVGHIYSVENFANLGTNNNTYEAADDHNWAFTIGPVTSNVVLSFVHFSVPESAITWTEGASCPGT